MTFTCLKARLKRGLSPLGSSVKGISVIFSAGGTVNSSDDEESDTEWLSGES